MSYEYMMVQIPPNIAVQAKKHKGNEAAAYLEHTVNKHAASGWEFYRIDPIGVAVKQGCLAALLGNSDVYVNYHVITFRRRPNTHG